MKTLNSKILKGIFLLSLSLLMLQSKAQTYPTYAASSSSPAWSTAYSFSNSSHWVDGFCFAWDAVSPLSTGSGMALVYVPRATVFTIYIPGHDYNVDLIQTPFFLPITSYWDASAYNIESYASTFLPGDQDSYDFWMGYAFLLEWACLNPDILLLTKGNQM